MKKQTWPGGLSKYFIQLILFFFLFPFQSAFAQLPQNREYQRELREYIATLSEDDFVVELSPLRVSNSYFNNDDDIYQAWLVFGEDSYEFPSSKGLRVDPKYFTLDEIESGGKVQMRIGRGEWMSTLTTAFFADWNYKGNPHYDSKAVKLRSFVAAAVDMMMMDQAHEEGDGDRSDFLGGQLTQWAYAYKVAKDILPDEAREAFEDGLIRMFEKLEKWGPTGIHADMDTRAAPGVLYVAESVESEDLSKRAYDYIDTILDRHFKSAGYIDHGGAYDGSYNGISLYHLTWAAYMSDYKPLVEALEKMVKLKSHLMLPDPDGVRNAPHHSNSSSPSSAANDQWGPHFRDAGIAGLVDDVGELALLGSEKIVNRSTMLENMEYRAGLINGSSGREDFDSPISEGPGAWKREHWTETHFNAIALNYKKGHYSKLRSAGEQELKLPFEREDNFVESFDDKFLAAKRDGYGAILFNDRLSWWTGEGDTKELNGFGGGNLSAFWTPGTGTVLLGVARGTRFGGHDLDDWAMWPVHALSGETENGRAFSSALQRHPEATYDLGNNPSMVTMEGNLADIYSDPTKVLEGTVEYKRKFSLKDGGIKVTTMVIADSTTAADSINQINQLYEILPVFLRDESNQTADQITTIEFEVNGNWQLATTALEKVSRIRLNRFGEEVMIEFINPRNVKLSPKDFFINPDQKSGAQIRNIMIDLLDSENSPATLNDQFVTYEIYNPNIETDIPEDDENKRSIYNYPNPFSTTTTITYELVQLQNVSLKIYDTYGRLVETIIEGEEQSGRMSKVFSPSSLASGIYFYQLISGGKTYTGKMTYIR